MRSIVYLYIFCVQRLCVHDDTYPLCRSKWVNLYRMIKWLNRWHPVDKGKIKIIKILVRVDMVYTNYTLHSCDILSFIWFLMSNIYFAHLLFNCWQHRWKTVHQTMKLPFYQQKVRRRKKLYLHFKIIRRYHINSLFRIIKTKTAILASLYICLLNIFQEI